MGNVVIKGREYGFETTTRLRFINVEITDGDPAEIGKLVNLKEMTLYCSGIKDISPIGSLTNLAELSLAGNKISDASALTRLPKLKYLRLMDNQICDITPLLQFANLRAMCVDGNPISDKDRETLEKELQSVDFSD